MCRLPWLSRNMQEEADPGKDVHLKHVVISCLGGCSDLPLDAVV